MIISQKQKEHFSTLKTPFYFYDVELLKKTLDTVTSEAKKYGYVLHYAFKANVNDKILNTIHRYGLGADCVSGNEVQKAIDMGFPKNEVVFAGVGKSDDEIITALKNDIFCFNCLRKVEKLSFFNLFLDSGKYNV